ncbi:hypothetical protein ZWY2020_016216 [Hordeum vulgare]|nr:hypothetical protein ZWY2020_016216 [Hordeum vulgare]
MFQPPSSQLRRLLMAPRRRRGEETRIQKAGHGGSQIHAGTGSASGEPYHGGRRPTPWSCSSRRGPTHSFPFPSAHTCGSTRGKTDRPATPCTHSRLAAVDALEDVHADVE